MKPPSEYVVLDRHGGFTAVVNFARCKGPSLLTFRRMDQEQAQKAVEHHRFDTLWQPGVSIAPNTKGRLVAFTDKSFYMNKGDLTLAIYEIPGYNYLVACWFDNLTGERIG